MVQQPVDLDFLEEVADFGDIYTESDVRWDELLASEEGQLVLDKLADEALAEIRAGNAKSNGNWPFNKPLLRE